MHIHECANEIIFTHDLSDESTFQMVKLMIYQYETMMVMSYNELIYGSFYAFPLISKAFIDNHEHANLIICI